MPTTLIELILERDLGAEGEIGGLALLPIHKTIYRLDPLFQVDLLEVIKDPSPLQYGHLPPSDGAPFQAPCSSA